MENKQTAVDFLIKEFSDILGPLETKPMQDLLMMAAMKQAKEMEKEQMVNFLKWTEGTYSFGNVQGLWYEHINTNKQYTTEELYNKYYKQTYGGKNGK